MDYEQALGYIHSVSWMGSRPGLERSRTLLKLMGDPQDKLRFIHIAGTNGKGSVSSMLASVLKEAGYRTGLYTSPYIVRFNDRIRFNGRPIPDKDLADVTEYVKGFADKMEDSPTEFELVTAIGFEYFYRKKCDIVVLEVGMGGELDSTNVIKTPLVSVITRIGLDHTKILGDTIEKIARTKCGIIKGGDTVSFCDDEAYTYIKEECEKRSSVLHKADPSVIVKKEFDINSIKFDYKTHNDVELSLVASYQYENACLVLETLDVLENKGFDISEEALLRGLKKAKWQARFEPLRKRPVVIFDGGHNPQGVEAAKKSFLMHFPDKKAAVVFGAMADKDVPKMLDIISGICKKMYTVTVDNPRAMKSDALTELAKSKWIDAVDAGSPGNALKMIKGEKTVLILGSLYMYEEIFNAFNKKVETNISFDSANIAYTKTKNAFLKFF